MPEDMRGDLNVLGILIENVILQDNRVLTLACGSKGRPTRRSPEEQIKTKTLRRLAEFNRLIRKAHLDPTRTDMPILTSIFQKAYGSNRQTAMDYARTLFAIYASFGANTPHSPKIVQK